MSLLACGSRRHLATEPPGFDPTGRVQYRLLTDATVEKPPSEDNAGRAVELVPPIANPSNKPPTYPDSQLKAGCRETRVAMRAFIDASGNVSNVQDSPLRDASHLPCPRAFREASLAAVRAWTFSPAFRQVQMSYGPQGQPEWEATAIPWYADFEFTFTVVDGKGVVR